ncbi:MAG TPA: FliM/FliN family flagellar motor switch protein [Burkholderiaceae bacterium]
MTTGQPTLPPSDDATPSVHPLALPPLTDGASDASPLLATAPVNPLHQIKTQLQVCIGDIHLTVGELMSAREHQVLVLDRQLSQPVDVMLEGRVVARGELVAVDDQFAVRITELPLPLKP